jgi:FixJ family two-component response regulator
MDQHRQPLIVLVEDDAAVRVALEFAFDLEGFRVSTCMSGEEALRLDLPQEDACLVLDERLPGISGLETLARLRAQGVRLPAVLITTHPGPRFRAAAAEAGVPILEKPLMDDALVASVRAALTV